jgi:hypothetical protein
MKFEQYLNKKETIEEMAGKPRRNKMQILVDKALKAVGDDKQKAASLAYQIMEDANFHSVNRTLVPQVDAELGLPITGPKETQTWYRAYDKDDASNYSMSLDWDSRVVELAQKILDGVGFKKVKLSLKDDTASEE